MLDYIDEDLDEPIIFKSLKYRARLMRLFNVLRGLIVAILAITLFFFIDNSSYWRTPTSSHSFLLILSIYYVSLVVHYWFSLHFKTQFWPILSNAIWDILILSILCDFLIRVEHWHILALILFCSSLLSVLTLTFREGIIFGFFIIVVLIGAYIIVLLADNVLLFKKDVILWEILFKNKIRLIEVLSIAFGLGLLVILMSRLAGQALENQLISLQNSAYAQKLRRLNDSILDNITSALIVIDANGSIQTLNKSARNLFNTDAYERQPTTLIELSSGLAKRLIKWKEMQIHNSTPLDIYHQSYTVIFSSLSGEKGLVLVQLENVIENMNRVRENRLNSLGRLTASIAHEIRNPLSTVKVSAELLLEKINENMIKISPEKEAKEIRSLCDKIQTSSNRIGSIISDILNIFSNKPRQNEVIKINNFIRYVVDEARLNHELENTYIKCDLNNSENYSVYFDPSQLRQVLDNLMLNAVKHSGRDDTIITIQTQKGQGERSMYIDVMDNGQGVRITDEERIFEPFYSSRNSMGLGLYLVREMCVANQAQVTYVRKNSGACFRIILECYLNEV